MELITDSDHYEIIPIGDMSHTDWLDLRRQGIGGSDLAAILQMSQYATPLDVYQSKVGFVVPEETEESQVQRWGNLLEPLVANEYARMYPDEKIIGSPGMLVSKKFPWMIANLDRIIFVDGEPGVFEIKTTGFPDGWGRDGGSEEDIPERVFCQVSHYMAVTGFAFSVVCVLFTASREMRRYFVRREESVIENIISIEKKWWTDHVINQNPPLPVNAADCKNLWLYDKGTTIIEDPEIRSVFETLHSVKEEIKRLEQEKEELETKVKKYMAENQILVGLSGKKLCTWKTQTANRFDVEKCKKEKPEIYKKYLKESTSRVFRLSK